MSYSLTSSQAELLQGLEASQTGLWVWNLQDDSVAWSPVCYSLLGLPQDGASLALEDFLRTVHPDDRLRVREEIAQKVRSQQPFASEYRIVRPDGTVRWLAESGRCIHGEDGTAWKLSGVLRDITEEKHTRHVLQESQERLRLAVEASGTGLWTWDLATDAVTWSSESYRIHGMEDGTFTGTGAAFFALVHPSDRERVVQTVRHALAHNEKYECEFRIVRPDGGIPWVANRGRPRYDDEGRPVGMMGTIADISSTRQVEQAMQAALEASGAGTFRWNIISNDLWWDDALDRLFGLTPGASVRSLEQFIALVHPDDRSGVIGRCDRCRTEGANFDMEFRIVRPDGSERWLYDRGRTFRDHEGRPASMTGACVDITERKHTERALRRSESFYRQALESIPGMTFTATRDGWWDYLSEQWQAYTGVSSSRLMGHAWMVVLHPDDRPEVTTRVEQSLVRKEPYETQYRVRSANGEYRWFKTRCRPILDASGDVASWIGTATDVHDLQEAQAALRESEERLRRAQRAGGIGVWEWDMAAGRAFWSEHTARLMGCRPPDLRAVDDAFWSAAVHPEDMPMMAAGLQAAYTTGSFHAEFRSVHADGTHLWLESDAQVVRDAAGKALKLVGTVRDVSERRRGEDALRAADQRKNEFLATLAHELRNPLAPLRTGLQLLKPGGQAPAAAEKTRAIMERQLAHLVRLVDDLMDIARIDQGKIEIRRAPVAVSGLVAHAAETVRELVQARRHTLVLDVPAQAGWVAGDATRLGQVLSNLLVNAAKYTPEGGHIELIVRSTEKEVEISVSDDGVGIAPELQARIFDLFVQGNGPKPAGGGMGIGLALVRRLVDLHGGSIVVESGGEGQGSRFVLRLPAVDAAPETLAQTGSEPAAAPAPIRVMVVDDNQDAAETMRLLLQLAGHEVRVASDGASALSFAREFRPGVTFLDIGLPGMNGYELARRFRADPDLSGGVLVALTGWASEQDRQKSLDAGFDLHFSKPVEPGLVESVLARLGADNAH